MPSRNESCLIGFRQRIPFVEVDEGKNHRAAFPPAWIVVVRRDLVEAELLVVVWTDPFGGVDGALFQRREDVATGDLLRHHTKFRQYLARESADAEFQAFEIINGIDLLAEPPTHLAAGIGGHQGDDVELFVEVVQEVHAAAVDHPCLVLALVGTEGDRSPERKSRIFAEIII